MRLASCSATGTPSRRPAMTTPALVKPPKPMMAWGLSARRNRRLRSRPWVCRQWKRRCTSGRQPNGALGTRSAARCRYFSRRRMSTILWLMNRVALWPRAISASASAMPGERWPPVPPQAMTNLFFIGPPHLRRVASCSTRLLGMSMEFSRQDLRERAPADERLGPLPGALGVDDDADEQAHQQQVRAAGADEGQRHALGGQPAGDDAEVDDGLERDEQHAAGHEEELEQVRRAAHVHQARDEDGHEQRDGEQGEDQPHLLAHDGEDVVGVRLGQEGVLLAAVAEPDAVHAAGGERQEGLPRLVAGALPVGLGIEEREQAHTDYIFAIMGEE